MAKNFPPPLDFMNLAGGETPLPITDSLCVAYMSHLEYYMSKFNDKYVLLCSATLRTTQIIKKQIIFYFVLHWVLIIFLCFITVSFC